MVYESAACILVAELLGARFVTANQVDCCGEDVPELKQFTKVPASRACGSWAEGIRVEPYPFVV